MSNLEITTQPSIEDAVTEEYNEEFTGLVAYFADMSGFYEFTDDEFHEALTEALNNRKGNNS